MSARTGRSTGEPTAEAKTSPVPAQAVPSATGRGTISDDWVVHANSKFSFHGPPDLTTVPLQGINSLVGRLENRRFHIAFDYGRYSDNSFDGHVDLPDFNVEHVTIDRRRAQLGSYDDNKHPEIHPFVYAAYFPDVGEIGAGTPEGMPTETKLYMRVCHKDPQFRDMAKRILMSIRLKE